MTPVDFTKLFSIIDSIVCSLIECTDESNTIYYLTVGYIGKQIVLKLDSEDNVSIYRFEMTSPRKSMEKVAWIISKRKLTVKIISYYFDGAKTNISKEFYKENSVQYALNSRCRYSEMVIKVSYNLYAPDIEGSQEFYDNYTVFMEMQNQNKDGYRVIEISPNPKRFLRKNKILGLLDD